jgi:hypothetical protein
MSHLKTIIYITWFLDENVTNTFLLKSLIFMLNQKCGRTDEQIEMLTLKLRIVDEELASGRWKTKLSKSHGRVVYLSLRDEKAR